VTQPGKKETLLAYLERGIAMLHLDARRKGVEVPAQHAEDPHLRLNLSYRYGIPDLTVDEEQVVATLSFRGRGFQCRVPWSAIFGITSQSTGEGQVWPEDLPSEVMSALAQQGNEAVVGDDEGEPMPTHRGAALAGQRPRKKAPPSRKKPALVAIDGEGLPETPEAGAEEPKKAPLASAPEVAQQDDKPAEPAAPSEAPRRNHLRLVR
jgi:stringent starvation protein B